jgi:hypothetical protein
MARWIKSDGTEEEVHPAGREFTNVELHNMVDGTLTGLTLTGRDQGGLFMFMDDEYSLKGKPVNQVATALLHHYQPRRYGHITVCGDVVVAGIDETGDE